MAIPTVANISTQLQSLQVLPYIHIESTAIRELKNNSLDSIKQFIKKNKDYLWKTGNILHLAASIGDHKHCKEFIEFGVSVNLRNSDGDTPLHLACQKGYSSVINALLAFKPELGIVNNLGQTAAQVAATAGLDANIIQMLQPISPWPNRILKEERIGARQVHHQAYKVQPIVLPDVIPKLQPISKSYQSISVTDFSQCFLHSRFIDEHVLKSCASYGRFDLLGVWCEHYPNINWLELQQNLNQAFLAGDINYTSGTQPSALLDYLHWLRSARKLDDIEKWLPLLTDTERTKFFNACYVDHDWSCLVSVMNSLKKSDSAMFINEHQQIIFTILREAQISLACRLLTQFPRLTELTDSRSFSLLHNLMIRKFATVDELKQATEVMIKAGCDVNMLDCKGRTFPYYAPQDQIILIIDCFIKHKGNPLSLDYKDQSLLSIAASLGRQDILQTAFELGFDWIADQTTWKAMFELSVVRYLTD